MAEDIVVEGRQYRKRSPWGVWGLAIITLGVYYFVWYYKINDEARRYLGDEKINPVLALLSQFVPIVHWISIWNTGERIARMQERAGTSQQVMPILGLLASLLLSLHIVYYQSELNKVWDRATVGQAPVTPASTPPPPPPPPPPAQP